MIFIYITMKHLKTYREQILVHSLIRHFHRCQCSLSMPSNPREAEERRRHREKDRENVKEAIIFQRCQPDKKATLVVSSTQQNTRFEKHLLPFYLALLNGLLVYSIPLVTIWKEWPSIEKRVSAQTKHSDDHCLWHIITH